MIPFLRANGFLLALVAATAAAWIFPDGGAKGGWLHAEIFLKYGIAVIFFNVGTLLPVERLREDLLEWRLHLLVQAGIFLFLPCLVLVFGPLLRSVTDPSLFLGFVFLAILPTTVSTAVVFTMQARGNVAGAVFNTSMANLLGLVLVPAWTLWHLPSSQTETLSVTSLLWRILLFQFFPLAAGQLLRAFARKTFETRRKLLARINNTIIFFVVYASFCDSVKADVWGGVGLFIVSATALVCLLLMTASHACMWIASGWAGMNHASRWCALFCGGQKSLAVGAAMLPVIFSEVEAASAGLILLPLLIYHFFQLMTGAILLRFIPPAPEATRAPE